MSQLQRSTNGKPNLVVLHPGRSISGYPFNIAKYRESYHDFFRLAQKKSAVFYVRTGASRYLGNGVFSHGYQFTGDKLVPYRHPIAAAVMYNKARFPHNSGAMWQIVNPWKLYGITYDKFGCYQLLKQYMKPTYRVTSRKTFVRSLQKIKTAWVVWKPVFGSEGRGIKIGPKSLIRRRIKRYDGLLQEFIDTSDGVPGVCKGLHDMRILLMNGRIVQSYVRQPRKGSYLANVAQGGRMLEIRKNQIPRRARAIAQRIDERFFNYFGPRIYAIDFGFERGKPYLFEINPQPGLPYRQWPLYYRAWHHELLNTLLSSIR
ncbi:MAG: ATP-grasp domain-containing protein [Patescibacteria group bacterium]|nr:ATP-grasp domain-containing protein [Patescibacteria group bacterium]MDD5715565.1 ATP-grasp domain-containing protein [Patescibacteria group bacterium]